MGTLSLVSWTLSTAAVNLDTINAGGAPDDWAEYTTAYTPTNRKNGGGSTISATITAGGGPSSVTDSRTVSFTNGTPTASGSSALSVFNTTFAVNQGATYVLPADTNVRTAWLVIGPYTTSTCKIVATLSDGSATTITDTTTLVGPGSSFNPGVLILSYSANSAGQTLTITITNQAASPQTHTLQGIAVAKAGGTAAALAGTPVSASSAAAALSTGINLAGTPTSVSTAVGNLMRLMGSAIVSSVASGALAVTASSLQGAAASLSSATGTLGGAIQMAAAALSATSAGGVLTNWSTVTLGSTLYTGVGSILDSHLWPGGVPTTGTVLFYDATNVTIQTDGSLVATSNQFSFVVQYQDATSPSDYQTAFVTVTPNMAAYADSTTSAVGALSTAIRLAGAAQSLVNAAASMNAQIQLRVAAQAVTVAIGDLTTQIILAATPLSTSAAQGTITGTVNSLAGNAQSDSNASGFLNAQIQLAGAATVLAVAVGNLSAQIRLAGAALSTSSGQGTVVTGTQLAAVAAIQTVASGALITAIRVSGAAISAAFAVAALGTQVMLLGAAVSASTASGQLSAATGIAGAAQSITTATAQLSSLISLSTSAFSISSASAALITGIPLEGGAIGLDTATGDLRATGSPVSTYAIDPFFVIGQRRQYFTQRFPVIGPGEEHILTFNFNDELAVGETLQGIVTMNVVASAGVDGNAPGNLLDGPAAYDTSLSKVLQPIHGAIQDNDYYFTVTVPTSNPFKTLTRFGLLSVRG
jgi:hypothetical protein